jgi:hypothetical protein
VAGPIQARQNWNVAATSPGGVTVSFHADETAPSRAPATLTLSVGASSGAARWTIVIPGASTAASRDSHPVDVQVSSDTSGTAELVLDMRVPPQLQAELSDQEAALTVTATVTSHD